MANYRYITSNGNWSTLAQWEYYNGASWVAAAVLPTVADNVYPNGFVVQVDQTISVKSLRCSAITGITAGGRFEISTNVNVTTVDGIFGNTANSASLNVNQSCILVTSACTSVITSYILGGGAYNIGLTINAAANITVIGNQNGNILGSYGLGLWNAAAAIISIIGNQNGGGTGGVSYCYGFYNTGVDAIITITGNQNSGNYYYAYGFYNTVAATISITGNQIGYYPVTYGFYNTGNATIIITGNQIGSSIAIDTPGFFNSGSISITIIGNQTAYISYAFINTKSGGIISITGIATASSTQPAIYNNTTSIIIFAGIAINNLSMLAIFSPRIYYNVDANSVWEFSDFDGNTQYLYGAGVNTGHPIEADVRKDTVFGPNDEFTGTAAIPAASEVVKGVPVDDTVGTWAFDATLIERLENCSTVAITGQQIANFQQP